MPEGISLKFHIVVNKDNIRILHIELENKTSKGREEQLNLLVSVLLFHKMKNYSLVE